MDTLIDIGIFYNKKGMAVGPVLGYVHQYYIISKSKSIGTFSIDICGILLFANILRLNFYVFTKFATSLLWQSINMILAQVLNASCLQIFLVHICCKWKNNKNKQEVNIENNEKQINNTESISNFWRWHQFTTYFLFILLFTFVSFSITFSFKQFDFEPYGVFVGLTALLSESILILPQIIRNYNKKSTEGLSYLLVGLNLFGDIFKLVYFIIKAQAFQFILCGVVQVVLDSYVILQIYLYRENTLVEQKDHKSVEQKNYNFDDVIKTDTQKNFDDIQMMENQVQKHSSTDDTDQNYGSERPSQIKQKQNDDYIYTTKEWGMKYTSTAQNEPIHHFEEDLKTIPEQNILETNKPQDENNKTLSEDMQLPHVGSDIQFKKSLSQKNKIINGSSQFFQPQYVLPPKSLQNVKVQG